MDFVFPICNKLVILHLVRDELGISCLFGCKYKKSVDINYFGFDKDFVYDTIYNDK